MLTPFFAVFLFFFPLFDYVINARTDRQQRQYDGQEDPRRVKPDILLCQPLRNVPRTVKSDQRCPHGSCHGRVIIEA